MGAQVTPVSRITLLVEYVFGREMSVKKSRPTFDDNLNKLDLLPPETRKLLRLPISSGQLKSSHVLEPKPGSWKLCLSYTFLSVISSSLLFFALVLTRHSSAGLKFPEDRQESKESRRESTGNEVLMCLVGGIRSYAYRQAHGSIHEKVYLALGGPKHVDVGIVVSYLMDSDSNGARNGKAQVCYNNSNIFGAFRSLHPKRVTILRENSCAEYTRTFNQSHCTSTKGFMQMALVHQCFVSNFEPNYKYFVRVRPDSFFSDPVPQLQSLQPAAVTTWLKYDAPGSDQFFIFSHELFDTWWLKVIKPRIEKGTFSCCPEYEMFSSVNVSQRSDINGCLLRDSRTLSCWISENAHSADDMRLQLDSFPYVGCTAIPSFEDFILLTRPFY